MSFEPSLWTRLEQDGLPIYLRGDRPDWFVPTSAGDALLRSPGPLRHDLEASRFLQRLPDAPALSYPGRAKVLAPVGLRELWLHLTDRCNLRCRHCLFSSQPDATRELPLEAALDVARQAADLGCRVFALTGGEPFVYPGFEALVDALLAYPGSHVAVLTNGLLLRAHRDALSRWPRDRFHLQVSVDGLDQRYERLRGRGTFPLLCDQLGWLRSRAIPTTLSMTVVQGNVEDMPGLVELAAGLEVENVHFMWYFVRGRGRPSGFVAPEVLFDQLTAAAERAETLGVVIDNLEAARTQVFAPPGTVHDGSGAGWESLALGPDLRLYPSAALVGVESLAVDLEDSLEASWRGDAVLHRIRCATAAEMTSPLRFFTGGGDLDHSYLHAGELVGHDPYLPLYERLALWLIAREAGRQQDRQRPELRLKMGDLLESCGAHGSIAFVHSNCLLSLAHPNARSVVQRFYSEAADNPRDDLRNPAPYPEELVAHIPEEARLRSYGCGSPVVDAELQPGETVVDLGCGTGVECFIAARQVGRRGQVIGVDMLPKMLLRAQRMAKRVAERLGHHNVDLCHGYLEALPLGTGAVDAVISNCVLNLSSHKRRTLSEAFRVLRPGGRFVVADVVCETEPDAALRNDQQLHGECIAGALSQRDLFGLLAETGFCSLRVIRRSPYRTVNGHPFFSLTFDARRPAETELGRVMYRGPFAAVVTDDDRLVPVGQTCEIPLPPILVPGPDLYVLDARAAPLGVESNPGCGCSEVELAPSCCCEPVAEVASEEADPLRHDSDCMVCGARIVYLRTERPERCVYCQSDVAANATCERGHFVCDACHSRDARAAIEQICLATRETDMAALMRMIRRHPSMSDHGPEHHAMIPGVVLSTYRNLGGDVSEEQIRTGIARGARVAGGSCAFTGGCGAALGIGAAFGILLGADPCRPEERQKVQKVVATVVAELAAFAAARCCQRDGWIALRTAVALSAEMLPITLRADARLVCEQVARNRECLGRDCPLHPRAVISLAAPEERPLRTRAARR